MNNKTKYPFPAVRVTGNGFSFNSRCSDLGESVSMDIYKHGDIILFVGRKDASGNNKIRRDTRLRTSFLVNAKAVIEVARLRAGDAYRLTPCATGWRININEPI